MYVKGVGNRRGKTKQSKIRIKKKRKKRNKIRKTELTLKEHLL